MYDGILNVYKEPGYTSFDVVAKLRGILRQKKIGHTGTLDPQAEGVLVVCLGKATKLCDVLPDHDKEYEAVLLLGVTTDTEDLTGTVESRSAVTVTEEQVREVLYSFLGTYEQIPPMYSAIKVNGQKLYELARQGKVVERQPRPVTIDQLEILELTLPRVRFRIRCSRGTYIRSLCRDVGERLGCGGCMEHLLRSRACGFTVQDSLRLADVETLVQKGALEQRIHTIDSMYPEYPKVKIAPEWNKRIYNGNKFRREHILTITEGTLEETGDCMETPPQVLVYDSNGEFFGIYHYRLETQEFVPYKMFL